MPKDEMHKDASHTDDNPKHKKHPQKMSHKKVFDITRPGKSIASPNSRSVIVGHKPPVQDDQFVPTAPTLRAADPFEKHGLLDHKQPAVIGPIVATHETQEATSAPALPTTEESLAEPRNPVETTISEPAPAEVAASAVVAPVVSEPEPTPVPEAAPAPALRSEPVTPTSPAPSPTSTPAIEASPDIPANSIESLSEETPAHLAMEQTVQTTDDLPIWEHPDTSEQVGTTPLHASTGESSVSSKSIEDLLAETGAPMLESEHTPSLIISHHKSRTPWWERILILLFVPLLAVAALNFLLDAEIIKTSLKLPYTDLIN